MEWAKQTSSWEQPAAKGSGPVDVMEPFVPGGKVANPDEAGNAHEDSPATVKANTVC